MLLPIIMDSITSAKGQKRVYPETLIYKIQSCKFYYYQNKKSRSKFRDERFAPKISGLKSAGQSGWGQNFCGTVREQKSGLSRPSCPQYCPVPCPSVGQSVLELI